MKLSHKLIALSKDPVSKEWIATFETKSGEKKVVGNLLFFLGLSFSSILIANCEQIDTFNFSRLRHGRNPEEYEKGISGSCK